MVEREDLSIHDPWIDEVCAALGVPRESLDVDAVLALAGRVAHRVARPMAPVSTFLAGYALASGAASFDAAPRPQYFQRSFRLPSVPVPSRPSPPITHRWLVASIQRIWFLRAPGVLVGDDVPRAG